MNIKSGSPENPVDGGSPTSDANNGHGINSKSRNARAQARHRAKRKAYIEQLEESVNTLQAALANRTSQPGGPGPSTLKIFELEQENARLRQENRALRAQLDEKVHSNTPDQNQNRRSPITPQYSEEFSNSERDASKKRKLSPIEPSYLGATSGASPPFNPSGSSDLAHMRDHHLLSHVRVDSQSSGSNGSTGVPSPPPVGGSSINDSARHRPDPREFQGPGRLLQPPTYYTDSSQPPNLLPSIQYPMYQSSMVKPLDFPNGDAMPPFMPSSSQYQLRNVMPANVPQPNWPMYMQHLPPPQPPSSHLGYNQRQ